MHEEAESISLEDLKSIQENLCQKLRDYNSEDIFNCDEMGLFWKLRLSCTISNGQYLKWNIQKNI